MQDLLLRLVAKGYAAQSKSVLKLCRLVALWCIRILFECVGELFCQSERRLPAGQQVRQLRHRLNEKVHQIHKNDHHAGGDGAAGQRKKRANQKHAELRRYAGHGPDHADNILNPALGEFLLLQRGVAFRKKAENLPLRPKALDDGKAAETVLQRGGKARVPFRHAPLRALQPVACENGGQKWQKRQAERDDRQHGRIQEHHDQRARKGHKLCDNGKLLRQIVRLHGGGVIGQGGQVHRRILRLKGGDAFFRQLLESKILVLQHRPPDKARLRGIADQIAQHTQRAETGAGPCQRFQRLRARHAGDRIDQLLHNPGKNQVEQSGDQRIGDRHRQRNPVLPVKLRDQLPLQGTTPFHFHSAPSTFHTDSSLQRTQSAAVPPPLRPVRCCRRRSLVFSAQRNESG